MELSKLNQPKLAWINALLEYTKQAKTINSVNLSAPLIAINVVISKHYLMEPVLANVQTVQFHLLHSHQSFNKDK